jgi:hypothetical protein
MSKIVLLKQMFLRRTESLRAATFAAMLCVAWCVSGCSTLKRWEEPEQGWQSGVDTIALPDAPSGSGVQVDHPEEGFTFRMSMPVTAAEFSVLEPGASRSHHLGVGLTYEYLWCSGSHEHYTASMADARPYWSTGVHFGFEPIGFGPGAQLPPAPTLLVEGVLARRSAIALRAGYEFMPASDASGPRATVELFGLVTIAGSYKPTQGPTVEVGILPHHIWGWIWAR